MKKFISWAKEAVEVALLFTFALGLLAGFIFGRLYFGGWL